MSIKYLITVQNIQGNYPHSTSVQNKSKLIHLLDDSVVRKGLLYKLRSEGDSDSSILPPN
jgi:hypothetical protein